MSEPNQAGPETPRMSNEPKGSQAAWFCNWLREGAEKASAAMSPPANATQHFREARLEILRGIREVIDSRIEYLSKGKTKGSRIVVE